MGTSTRGMSARVATNGVDRFRAEIRPASGAAVMATGIISVAVALEGLEALSRVLLAIAALEWMAIGLLLADRALRNPDRVRLEARTPGALTGVAATAVLGARVTPLGWTWAGAALLVIASALWCLLIAPVLLHLATPTGGVCLMLTVSTESLAELAATIAGKDGEPWLLYASLAPFLLGLLFYAIVIVRFDPRQLITGCGDQWVTGGALAISALAAAHIALADGTVRALAGIHTQLRVVVLMLWAAALAWLPVLMATELVRPRLGYDTRRWATVFPIGMYAACSYVVGATEAAPAITGFGRVWTWAAFAAWLVVTASMLCAGSKTLRLPAQRDGGG
jgi:tellurite resistance protein TehA-like permease